MPYRIDWEPVPELIRRSILDLGGVQPVTLSMSHAAGGELYDRPSPDELELFRAQNTEFQMISVVASLIEMSVTNDVLTGTPFAITLIPASKRGKIAVLAANFLNKIDPTRFTNEARPVYMGYDPFRGDWEMYGPASVFMRGSEGFLDEVGVVIDTFFLATSFNPEEVLTLHIGMPDGTASEKYRRRRRDLLFRPFDKIEARRIWGAESPIELFVLQELARHGLHPSLQILIMNDGRTFPSWYHLWKDVEFRHSSDIITEVDMYFPEQKVAVFCDGAHHLRRKQREKDLLIDAKLLELGIKSVRVSGREIMQDLAKSRERVFDALGNGRNFE